MDRRQAFYAFVGCMLIVSVAFVVGLIVGQRMQLVELPGGPALALNAPGADARSGGASAEADDEDDEVALLPVADERSGADDAPEDFTFYDALNRPRPEVEAARLRPLAREPEGAAVAAVAVPPAAEGGVATPEPEPERTPEPVRPPRVEPVTPPAAATPTAPRSEPARPVQVADAPRPADSEETRVVSRRVRRVGEQSSAGGVEEFGHFIVEAGRFDAYEAAAAARERLAASGHSAVVSMAGEGPNPYRVEVGDAFTRRSEAQSLANRVGGRVVSQR